MAKRILTLGILCIFLAGCGTVPQAPSSVQEEEIPETELQNTTFQTEESRETTQNLELFLTVSHIDFSLVGDSERIYAGSVPVEKVNFLSEDPAIIRAENGVLTAVGVGTTRVTASWKDQELSCTAGCLAENEEQLQHLPDEVLEKPMRIPPVTDDSCLKILENGAMVGDSITYGLMFWENKTGNLGHPRFLTRGGTSIMGLLLGSHLLYCQGQEMRLEDAVQQTGVESVCIMLGQNDLGYMSVEDTIENLHILLERVRKQNPEVRIYLQTCSPEFGTERQGRNTKIQEYNRALLAYAEDQQIVCLDVAPYLEDHHLCLPGSYALDEIHMNEAGCLAWMAALREEMHRQKIYVTEGK